MNFITLKKAIVDKLRAAVPAVKIYSTEIQQGFSKPAFFVQMIPFGLSASGKYHTAKSVNIDIHYFSQNDTEIEWLEMLDTLLSVFRSTLSVEDRRLLIENIESESGDEVFHFKFDLSFTDTTEGIILTDDYGAQVTIPVEDLDSGLGYDETNVDFMRELDLKEEE